MLQHISQRSLTLLFSHFISPQTIISVSGFGLQPHNMDQDVCQEKGSERDGSRDQNVELGSVGETKPETNSSDKDRSTAKEEQEDEAQYPSGIRLGLVMLALCLAVFLVSLDNSIISTAIPKITDEFNSLGDIGWYGSGPYSELLSLLLQTQPSLHSNSG